MLETLATQMLDPSGLTPHGFCLLWEPGLIWTYALSDTVIGLAYFAIPAAVVRFVSHRPDIAFKPVFWLFAAFILLCGTTHWVDLITIWLPAYRLEAVVKVATALVSAATAVALWPLIPRALALPSPAQMQAANDALRESAARFRAAFLRSPTPLHILDGEGRIIGVSDRWLDLLGYTDPEQVIGRSINEFQDHSADLQPGPAASAARWSRLLATGELRDSERRFVRRDGEVLDVLVSARVEQAPGEVSPEGTFWVVGSLVDVTARKRAEAALQASEERLRQTQKLEALGQLAGGVAHDFNNVLQAISGGASLIERRADDPAAVRRLARMVAEAAGRGSAITRRLLALARRNELRAAPVAADVLLCDLREILAHTLGAAITVHVEAPESLPPLLADRGELETVLVNLATNARDAMPEGGALRLLAAAERVAPGEEHPVGLTPGLYVRLAVADTGIGMDKETLRRATEPFFTTKPVDKGTGLGLAMARGFAQQSGGALAIASTEGEGTTVSLWLPQAAGPAGRAPLRGAGATAEAVAAAPAAGGPRVMLVDDEALVRTVLSGELEEYGFDVTPVEDPAAALARLDAGAAVDLLVTDLSMPGMDGVRLIREAQRRRPGLHAILLTGDAGGTTSLAVSGAVTGSFSLLRKPISGADLADRVAALLEARRGEARPAPA